jgi:hypothetical protein
MAEDPGESAFGAIGISRNEKYLHQEITIGDFPTRLEPLIGGTRGERSRGVRVRHFGVPSARKTLQQKSRSRDIR